MALKGMDIEEVRGLGTRCNSARDQLTSMKGNITSSLQSLYWEGSDADTFRAERWAEAGRLFEELALKIEELGRVAAANADAQAAVSARI